MRRKLFVIDLEKTVDNNKLTCKAIEGHDTEEEAKEHHGRIMKALMKNSVEV